MEHGLTANLRFKWRRALPAAECDPVGLLPVTMEALAPQFERPTPAAAPTPVIGAAAKGDSYENALAETINGLYKAELIHRHVPCKTCWPVELATLEWVAWFNHHRLIEPLGYSSDWRTPARLPDSEIMIVRRKSAPRIWPSMRAVGPHGASTYSFWA